jgi:hypothetical protein
MSGPPNLKAYQRSQALRAEIRSILVSHSQLQPLLAAKDILRLLKPRRAMPSERTVRWLVAQLRLKAELEALDVLPPRQFSP